MKVPVSISQAATDDIEHAEAYFANLRAGLGVQFEDEVFSTLTKVGEMPLGFGVVSHGVRALGLRRFGYVVYYRSDGVVAEVLAVLHGSQPPEVWQARI